MIYEIDKSCLETIRTNDKNCVAFFEQLALDRRKRKNIIVAKREVFAELAKMECFSSVSRHVYRAIGNRVSEHKLILKYAQRYCRIVAEREGETVVHNGDKKIVVFTISEVVSKEFTSKALMLAENEEDIMFYKILGQYYVKQKEVGNIKIDFEACNGGGSTTYTVLQRILTDKERMCLCIVDSDKKHGNATPRETMQKVEETIEGIIQDHFEVVFLDVHEVENLVPLNVWDVVTKENNISTNGIDFMKFLLKRDSSRTSPVFFYDIKKGIPKSAYILEDGADEKRIKKFRKLEEYRAYWRPYIEEYGATIEAEENVIIAGICDKALRYAIKYFELLVNEKGIETVDIDSYLREVWLNIGEKVFCWGCVGGSLAV